MDINEIYIKEKIINSYFKEKYSYDSDEIFNKQLLELHCELSEFAYETKCFKYWKNEKQSDPEITISEFADCLMITLGFCDLANINDIILEESNNEDMVELFLETHRLVSTLSKNLEKEILFKILSNLLAISKLLNYTDKQLHDFCINKMNKTLEMISK